MVRHRMSASSSSWSLPGSVMITRGTAGGEPLPSPAALSLAAAVAAVVSAAVGSTACCSRVLRPRSCLGSDRSRRCAAPLAAAAPVSTPMYAPWPLQRSTPKPTLSRAAAERRHAAAATRATPLRLTTGVATSPAPPAPPAPPPAPPASSRSSPALSRAARALRRMSHSAARPAATAAWAGSPAGRAPSRQPRSSALAPHSASCPTPPCATPPTATPPCATPPCATAALGCAAAPAIAPGAPLAPRPWLECEHRCQSSVRRSSSLRLHSAACSSGAICSLPPAPLPPASLPRQPSRHASRRG